ncbi:MAG: glycosyltransferase [Candidatus Sericytochromatia bacterium]
MYIAKDEEANIQECLESIYDIVDEIIVLDTGSKDRTREIAKHLTK